MQSNKNVFIKFQILILDIIARFLETFLSFMSSSSSNFNNAEHNLRGLILPRSVVSESFNLRTWYEYYFLEIIFHYNHFYFIFVQFISCWHSKNFLKFHYINAALFIRETL